MAIIKCKECKQDVSSKAKSCPHCGVKSPGVTKKDMLLGALVLAGAAYAIASCVDGGEAKKDGGAARAAMTAEEKTKADAQCKAELSCWGEKHIIAASVYCKEPIERLAKYDVKWTDGLMETAMSRYRFADREAATLTYVGDKAQFQNGFGAWQNVVYECDIDPASNRILGVRVSEGRL
ncbi:zinc ribbon domain-containing protein [Pandoraea sp.]|uniref:zinc ribbon domain-containing protein n=1 Tax=Pandoraea sp. TaxID=1883445 RepID=UPI00121E8A18|nr:zinc ribbon domain-containing protein [Pandoraea sp.]TAL53801.1 MAG: zinc ribbon domain-containing protein [Pandoraea sp.]TAM17054.1 MAG: zinc ribbon domain-containing protein [Pandoraea sp.]